MRLRLPASLTKASLFRNRRTPPDATRTASLLMTDQLNGPLYGTTRVFGLCRESSSPRASGSVLSLSTTMISHGPLYASIAPRRFVRHWRRRSALLRVGTMTDTAGGSSGKAHVNPTAPLRGPWNASTKSSARARTPCRSRWHSRRQAEAYRPARDDPPPRSLLQAPYASGTAGGRRGVHRRLRPFRGTSGRNHDLARRRIERESLQRCAREPSPPPEGEQDNSVR